MDGISLMQLRLEDTAIPAHPWVRRDPERFIMRIQCASPPVGADHADTLLIEHDHSFGPDEISRLVAGFEGAFGALGLVRRDGPAIR